MRRMCDVKKEGGRGEEVVQMGKGEARWVALFLKSLVPIPFLPPLLSPLCIFSNTPVCIVVASASAWHLTWEMRGTTPVGQSFRRHGQLLCTR